MTRAVSESSVGHMLVWCVLVMSYILTRCLSSPLGYRMPVCFQTCFQHASIVFFKGECGTNVVARAIEAFLFSEVGIVISRAQARIGIDYKSGMGSSDVIGGRCVMHISSETTVTRRHSTFLDHTIE